MSSVVPPVNVLIWLSVKPIIKLVIPCLMGFALTKAGLFPVAGSRAAAQIILNVTLPSLLFAKMVPSFNSDNISAIGPIVIVALFYMAFSLALGLIIRFAFPTPKNFRFGIICAAGWSNWGDLPTAVVSTVAFSAPFGGQADSDLAIAYVAIFILVYYVTLFPMQGVKLIERDYTHPYIEPEGSDPDESDNTPGLNFGSLKRRLSPRGGHKSKQSISDAEKGGSAVEDAPAEFAALERARSSRQSDLRRVGSIRSNITVQELTGAATAPGFEPSMGRGRRASSSASRHPRIGGLEKERMSTIMASRAGSRANSVLDQTTSRDLDSGDTSDLSMIKDEGKDSRPDDSSSGPPPKVWKRIMLSLKGFVQSLITPPTMSLVTAIVCALVTPLKALFVDITEGNFHPTAPDGEPPLSIVLSAVAFMGGASVPLGLIVLGAAIARMRIPRPISRLPLASIISLAIAKLVLLPIVAFFFVEALTFHTSLIPPENKILRFVLIYFSVVPTATTQMSITQVFAPLDGESNTDQLAAYIIFQYLIFAVSSVVLTSLTLRSLF